MTNLIVSFALAAAFALFVLPVVVFLCVKLGTVAYLKGRRLGMREEEGHDD